MKEELLLFSKMESVPIFRPYYLENGGPLTESLLGREASERRTDLVPKNGVCPYFSPQRNDILMPHPIIPCQPEVILYGTPFFK
jgi:hypothetical protein